MKRLPIVLSLLLLVAITSNAVAMSSSVPSVETWESGTDGWTNVCINIFEFCGSPGGVPVLVADPDGVHGTVQRSTARTQGGDQFSPLINVVPNHDYCVSALIKFVGGGWPYIGVDHNNYHGLAAFYGFDSGWNVDWIIGAASGGAPVVVSSADTAWHRYADTWTSDAVATQVRLVDEVSNGASRGGATLSYFDDIGIADGPCPTLAPTLTKSFGLASLPLNAATTLTFTIVNPNAAAVTGIAFTDPLPAGLVVSTPNGLSIFTSCGGTITAAAGSGTVSLAAGSLAGGASCSFQVGVKAIAVGPQTNVTSAITSTEVGPGLPAQASLTVVTAQQAAGGLGSGIAGSTASPTTKTVDAGILATVQSYLALPGGLGKPAACLLLTNLRAQTVASGDPGVIAAAAGPGGWLAQIDALKASIGCLN